MEVMMRNEEWIKQKHKELSIEVENLEKIRDKDRRGETKQKLVELKKQKLALKDMIH